MGPGAADLGGVLHGDRRRPANTDVQHRRSTERCRGRGRLLVNVVDVTPLCNFILSPCDFLVGAPARFGDFAISTAGAFGRRLAKRIKAAEVEGQFGRGALRQARGAAERRWRGAWAKGHAADLPGTAKEVLEGIVGGRPGTRFAGCATRGPRQPGREAVSRDDEAGGPAGEAPRKAGWAGLLITVPARAGPSPLGRADDC